MPGYYIHLAASNKLARKNRSFICGVEMPDLLKHYSKLYKLDDIRQKYDDIKTKDMPDFSFFEARVQQKEKNNSSDGMHFGWSSNPDISFFWNSLTDSQKQNPFFIGYLWHLLTDLLIYTYLDIDTKFVNFNLEHANDKNLNDLINLEMKKLHDDWDKTNDKICKMYPDVVIPQEILELKIIKYIADDKTFYVDWNVIKPLIDFMQVFDPLNQDINKIIEDIMNFLPAPEDSNISKEKVLNKRKI